MYLGIDLGTSGVKAVIVDEAGRIAAQSGAELTVSRPRPLWSEQDPDDWWIAAGRAMTGLDAGLRRAVRAVGLSGQMHGATLLDDCDRPLRPAILWNDGRSFQECAELTATTPEFETVAGNLVMPGFTAPKLAWVRRHEPDVFARTRTVLLPKDYVRLRMTGEKASDMSDSSGTLWMDVGGRRWSPVLLGACGLDMARMPRLHEGPAVTGRLRREVADAWGLGPVPVVAGGGDNAAGALGVGVTDEGQALVSLGTSGVVFLAGRTFRACPARAVHAFCHALPGRWHVMAVMLSAASCVDWAARLTGAESAQALIERARARGRIASGEIFLPYLSGERTPHNNPHAAGVLFGLTHDSDVAAIGQAVLEGVAFGIADGFEALAGAGASVESISVIGGGAQSLYWGRLLAGALRRPLVYRDGASTGPAVGAARLARFGTDGGAIDTVFAPPAVVEVVEPAAGDVEPLQRGYERFKSLYADLRHEFVPAVVSAGAGRGRR